MVDIHPIDIVTYSQLGKQGRIGNCFFQLAAAVAYSDRTGKGCMLPEWEGFEYLHAHIFKGVVPDARLYKEPAFSYNEIPVMDGNVDLWGFFQSSKYWEGQEDLIRNIIKLKPKYRDIVQRKSLNAIMDCHYNNGFSSDRVCAIHVRRSDYVSNPHTNAYHGVLPLSYYEAAIDRLYRNPENILFYIFSDDQDWCKKNFTFLPHVIFSENEDPMIDLFLQASCDDNIIANSSFSWWSAFLNRHPRKRVVAPKNWFANAGLDTRDLYCKDWIVL